MHYACVEDSGCVEQNPILPFFKRFSESVEEPLLV